DRAGRWQNVLVGRARPGAPWQGLHPGPGGVMSEGGLAVAAATAASPSGGPGLQGLSADEVLAQAAHENFPVALRVLPPAERRRLEAIYGYARLVDDAGDVYEGDRSALLDWIEADLDRAYAGRAEHPLLQRVS